MAYSRCGSMSESGTCQVCAQRGQKNDLQLFQINLHQAVLLCPNKQCTYPLGIKSSPGLLVQRKATEITNLKRKKCRTDNKTGTQKSRKIAKSASVQAVSSQKQSGSCQSVLSKTPVSGWNTQVKCHFPAFKPQKMTKLGRDEKCDSSDSRLDNRSSCFPDGNPSWSSSTDKQELCKGSATVTGTLYIQWQNRDALCWLDVLLCLLVHSKQTRDFCNKVQLSIISRLIAAYDQAQKLLMNVLEQKHTKTEKAKVIQVDTIVGDVPLKTGGGSRVRSGSMSTCSSETDLCSLHSDGDAMMQDFLDSIVIPGIDNDSNAEKSTPSTETDIVNHKMPSCDNQTDPVTCKCFDQDQTCQDCMQKILTTSTFKKIQYELNSVRDKIWNCLQPRLKCRKGKNDSPVFALPLLMKQVLGFDDLFRIQYRWKLTCDVCGHEVTDRYTKLFATFPNVEADFSMTNPYFVRTCFRCGAKGQKMNMIVDRFPGILIVYFVEGLEAGKLTDQDFTAGGATYRVRGVVQYTTKPDHFVCWIRSASGVR